MGLNGFSRGARSTARLYDVRVDVVEYWMHKYYDSSFASGEIGGKKHFIDPEDRERMKQLIYDKSKNMPTTTLKAYQSCIQESLHLKVSIGTISTLIKELGLSYVTFVFHVGFFFVFFHSHAFVTDTLAITGAKLASPFQQTS